MSFTHRVTSQYIDDTGVAIGGTNTYSGTVEKNYDNAGLAGGTTNQSVAITFTRATLQSLVMNASQPTTILTNSTSSPGNTINLAAGQTIIWTYDSTAPNPFTVDVTVLYISVPGATASAIKLRFLLA
jgi:hypothetical protein